MIPDQQLRAILREWVQVGDDESVEDYINNHLDATLLWSAIINGIADLNLDADPVIASVERWQKLLKLSASLAAVQPSPKKGGGWDIAPLEFETDSEYRQGWEGMFTSLLEPYKDTIIDHLLPLIVREANPEDRYLSAKWFAERLWHKRICHPNPGTSQMIKALIATSGKKQIIEVWQPKAVIIAVGGTDILKLNLQECEKRIGTEAYSQFEDMVWEECRGIPRRDARRQGEPPTEETPDDRPSILDALIALETPRTLYSFLESPKYTRKMKAYLRTELDLLKEYPDVPEGDLITLICERLKISPVNARKIKSRIRQK